MAPFLLTVILLVLIIVNLLLDDIVWMILSLILATSWGYMLGHLNNPAVSFRRKIFKKQSRDLQKLHEQFKIHSAAMRSAANGIIITDTNGIIEWVNPGFTKLTGYTAEESVGNTLGFLNSGIHGKEFFARMWTDILSGKVWHDEIVNKRKDGTLYTEEMTITPVVDDQEQIRSFVAIKQDISERKRLEEIMQVEKKRMETELDIARDIQMSMLRKNSAEFEENPDVEVYAELIPAREVGGDFYDYYWLDDENICFVIGDVSGKGVPAALFMAVAKTLIKSSVSITKSVSQTLTQVNNEISRDNENSMFVTVVLGILNTTTGYLSYSNAGHNTSYLISHPDGQVKPLSDLHGVVIGAIDGIEYGETVQRIARGDSIFVYTDGITEARNLNNELFSEERLVSILNSQNSKSSQDLVEHILQQIKDHENGAEPADDITILKISFKEQSDASLVDYLFINLDSSMNSVHSFSQQFSDFANKHKVDEEILQQLKIVFDELLSNIVKYAFQDEESHEIEVKVRYYGQKITVTILDDGIPFNPFDSVPADTQAEITEREIGGLGIHLVKFFVDDYEYVYKKQIEKNSTHFTKNLIINK